MFWGTVKNIMPSVLVLILGLYAAQYILETMPNGPGRMGDDGRRYGSMEPAAGDIFNVDAVTMEEPEDMVMPENMAEDAQINIEAMKEDDESKTENSHHSPKATVE